MMNLRRALLLSLPCSFAFAAACGGGTENLPPPPPPPPPPPATAAPPPPAVDAGATTAAPPAAPPTLVAGAAAADPTPAPTAKFAAPKAGEVIPSDKVADYSIKLDVKNWKTATGDAHVHLILDNRPYKPIYDTKQPVKMSDLTGGAALDEGQHVLVAFPSRATHESVKTKDAMSIISFYVGKKGTDKVDTKKPMLVYSRPKGDYKGAMADHVLVDFQLANDTLAPGKDHVNVNVTGPGIDQPLTAKVEKFGTPYYLDGLHDGAYTVKLELADKDDKLVPGAWNSTTRTINVDHAAQAEPMPGMSMGGADAGAAADAAGAAPKKK